MALHNCYYSYNILMKIKDIIVFVFALRTNNRVCLFVCCCFALGGGVGGTLYLLLLPIHINENKTFSCLRFFH